MMAQQQMAGGPGAGSSGAQTASPEPPSSPSGPPVLPAPRQIANQVTASTGPPAVG